MTMRNLCAIIQTETKNNYFTERTTIMKTISSAIIYKSEWQQAIFQHEEYSYSEVRPYQDEQKNRIGWCSC